MCYKSDNVDEHHFSFTSINAIQRYINSTWQRRLCRKKNHMTLFFAQLHILIIEKACGSCNFDFLFLFWNFGPLNLKKFNNLLNNFFGIPENCQIFKYIGQIWKSLGILKVGWF